MLGSGGNGDAVFPLFLEGNFQYDANTFPRLQLPGDRVFPCSVVLHRSPINFPENEHATAVGLSIKRAWEPEPFPLLQKLPISLNNEVGHSESILNSNPVSTGLRLSYDVDEHNSSITSSVENIQAVSQGIIPARIWAKTEIDQQKEELDCYIKVQEQNMIRGLKELNQRHKASFLQAVEIGISKKLCEKDLEIENMNRKNKELEEKIKRVAMEAQSWHYKAKYIESIANVLKGNLQQIIAQGTMQPKEGCGDSEVDDAASGFGGPGPFVSPHCKACNIKEACVILLPCRHLCLCKDCEEFSNGCPICQVMKTTSFQVYTS